MYAAFDYRVPDDYFYVQAIATFTDRDGRYDQFYCRGINCSYVDGSAYLCGRHHALLY